MPHTPPTVWEGRHLGQVMAEAVAAVTVHAELAQGGGAGRTLGKATGVVSLNHSGHQGIKVLLAGQSRM